MAKSKLRTLRSTVRPIDMRTTRPAKKVADNFYQSSAWRNLVSEIISERGQTCENCRKSHEDDGSSVRLIADHIVERRDGGPDLDKKNIQLLCVKEGGNGRRHSDGKLGGCHNRKTAEAAKERLY